MGNTFYLDRLYTDEQEYGISPGLNLDETYSLDFEYASDLDMTLDFTESNVYKAIEDLLDKFQLDMYVDEDYSDYVDLLKYMPSKFRNSSLLQEFLDECGRLTGSWLASINDLAYQVDPYNVPEDYIQNLASLLGLEILFDENTTIAEKRAQLLQVIDWYKRKGTYASLQNIGYALGFTVAMQDMYTNDYETFVEEAWYVGAEGTNPTGLDDTYYKSPHMGFNIVLDTEYTELPYSYLFKSTMYDDLYTYVERCRPINVVPHYRLLLTAETSEDTVVYEGPGGVSTCVVGSWTFTRLYLDDSKSMDDSLFLDFTDDALYNSIVVWKVGTGSKGIPPSNTGFALETPILDGAITTTTVYADRVEYDFTVPGALVSAGLSELGLYLTDEATLEVAATFPNIYLTEDVDLKVKVIINRI